jgi:hypothetical protein
MKGKTAAALTHGRIFLFSNSIKKTRRNERRQSALENEIKNSNADYGGDELLWRIITKTKGGILLLLKKPIGKKKKKKTKKEMQDFSRSDKDELDTGGVRANYMETNFFNRG